MAALFAGTLPVLAAIWLSYLDTKHEAEYELHQSVINISQRSEKLLTTVNNTLNNLSNISVKCTHNGILRLRACLKSSSLSQKAPRLVKRP